jgi:tetratricopeptide (TPR) repeat protein
MKKDPIKKGPSRKGHPNLKQQHKETVKKYNFNNLIGIAIIILLGIIIYSNSFNCSFHFDDMTRIVDNPSIRNLSDVKAWMNIYPSRPVGMFTLAMNYHFNKLDVFYYHLVNLIIHLINACLAGWLTLLVFSSPVMKDTTISKQKKIIAFVTALFFVSHPLATQSVTYIIQRLSSLAAMFYLLSIVLYVKARLINKSRSSTYFLFAGSVIFGVLAILTKENAITLPFAALLFEIFFLRTKKISINFKNPKVILMIGAIVIVIISIPLLLATSIFRPLPASQYNPVIITPLNYFYTQLNVIIKYIQLLILPISQNLDYDFPVSETFFSIRTVLSFFVLAGLIVLAFLLYKRNRIISFCIFWFFLTLSIESSFIPINDVIFEHRTYLPSFGYFLLLTTVIFLFPWNKYRFLIISVVVIIIGSNSFLTFERNKAWKDNLTLWNDVISKSPDKARPYINRGFAYTSLGQLDKAIEDYSKAIEINPNFTDSYYNRGLAYMNSGQPEKAMADYSKALEIEPTYGKAYSSRGVVYFNLRQWDQAIADYSKAIDTDPKYADAYYNRGIVYNNLGQLDKAISDYSKAIELNPGYAAAYSNRGNAFVSIRQIDKAIADYNKAIETDPDYRDGFYNRGIAYFNLGQYDKAIDDFTSATRIDPGCSTAFSNRGVAYASQGHWIEAIDDYSRALEIDPNYIDAYINRGAAYSNLGQWKNAIDDYSKALNINPNYINVYLNRGTAYSHLEQWDLALSDFNTAVKLNPANTTSRTDYNLAFQRTHSKKR